MSNILFLLTNKTTDLTELLLRLQMEKEAEAQAAREAEEVTGMHSKCIVFI